MNVPLRVVAQSACLATAAAFLSGCYVVPIHPPVSQTPVHSPAPVVPPAPLTFSARLYPSNDQAAAYGIVGAVVTNELNGRGHFTTQIGGETFTGEATRQSNPGREGVANGAGSRGAYIACRYTMNSATQGTGTCRHSSGATFTMHVGL